jgi:hypothetical protein
MESRKKIFIFSVSMLIALFFWRIVVFLRAEDISVIRDVTGFNFHHYHYGMILVFISCLTFIFSKPEKYSILLAGFGFGTFFDGTISRILGGMERTIEINNYNSAFGSTLLLFCILITSGLCVYVFYRK